MFNNFDPKKHRKYVPVNKSKYNGKNIPITRSSWEYDFCKILDFDPKVIKWSSESLFIPYMFGGKKKRYYPDFYVVVKLPNGDIEKWVVEIKPYVQTKPPIITKGKSKKTKLNEKITWSRNQAKWKSAQRFCKKFGYKFKIITEKQLYK